MSTINCCDGCSRGGCACGGVQVFTFRDEKKERLRDAYRIT
jgi:hypothetical protein